MPLPPEFLHHLHELMVEVSDNLREEEAAYKSQLLFEAQRKNNRAAVVSAYKDAALHAFSNRIRATIERYIAALSIWRIVLDESVERELLQQINLLMGVPRELHFPPGLQHSSEISPIQRSYAQELDRRINAFQRSAANRLREAKVSGKTQLHTTTLEEPEVSPRTMGASDSQTDSPRVFVSYSWDSDAHKLWVRELATKLRGEGVNVILDYWDLKYGGDRLRFMENNLQTSDFVLVVLTPEYAEKGNKRLGGVGYEAMIITGELAEHIDSVKFVPILRRGDWNTASPVWLRTKMGVDLRAECLPTEEFNKLLSDLHGKHLAPPMGTYSGIAVSKWDEAKAVTPARAFDPFSMSQKWMGISTELAKACHSLRADSQRRSNQSVEDWRLAGPHERTCEALLRQAGSMLLVSPNVSSMLLAHTRAEPNHLTRWLRFLTDQGCHQVTMVGKDDEGAIFLGSIRDLGAKSVSACIECATKELE